MKCHITTYNVPVSRSCTSYDGVTTFNSYESLSFSNPLRFRHEYRLERKMMNCQYVDDAVITVEGECSSTTGSVRLHEILGPLTCDEPPSKTSSSSSLFRPSSSSTSRREISRVVVLHNDKVASFSNPSFTENYRYNVPEDFFDTPEFWSGSITWW